MKITYSQDKRFHANRISIYQFSDFVLLPHFVFTKE